MSPTGIGKWGGGPSAHGIRGLGMRDLAGYERVVARHESAPIHRDVGARDVPALRLPGVRS